MILDFNSVQVGVPAECQAGSWAGHMVQKEGWIRFGVNLPKRTMQTNVYIKYYIKYALNNTILS